MLSLQGLECNCSIIIFIITQNHFMDNERDERAISILHLFEHIQHIDRLAGFNNFTKEPIDINSLQLQPYLACLAAIAEKLQMLKTHEEEYKKLQLALQKQETEIRKRISQQLKLYTDALKIQVEEIEKQKVELLENSKAYIKELKSNNQKLFNQLSKLKSSPAHSPSKTDKSKFKGSSSKKAKADPSIRDIIKTEHIERINSNSENKKKPGSKKQAYSTISHQEGNGLHQNSKTFHVGRESGKKEKLNPNGSKKRNKFLFSNYTLLNYLQNSNGKLQKNQKKSSISKSPLKIKKEGKLMLKPKNKKHNKSILSVPSAEPNSHKKQTI